MGSQVFSSQVSFIDIGTKIPKGGSLYKILSYKVKRCDVEKYILNPRDVTQHSPYSVSLIQHEGWLILRHVGLAV